MGRKSKEFPLHLLGTMPDARVAEIAGCSRQYVHQIRTKLGIEQQQNFNAVASSRRSEPVLSLIRDDLGKMPDRKVAEKHGVCSATVQHHRQRLGIPAYGMKDYRVPWTDETLARLGLVTDKKLAAEIGVSFIAVFRKRKQLGIPMQVDGRRK